YSGVLADIDQYLCVKSGTCSNVCRWDAIPFNNGEYRVNPLDCEGCGYCARVCQMEAISMIEQNVGKWYISETRMNNTMIHAKLGIGAENSGKLVAHVKNKAKMLAIETKKEFVLVDGSPGIGCPVVSSLSGAHFVVLVTEPTVAGLHDLRRVYQLVKKFQIPAGCIINKSDLNIKVSDEIKKFLQDEDIVHLADFGYDENFTKAMTLGKTIVEYDNGKLRDTLTDTWNEIKKIVNH
ncbi:MAG: 4Fe-4S binding protein, partial [Candidatus Cloacimonetes bacterium]|nr:4Fe-4S binding protein [Candidatus Cloacimonadota bacterium]